MKICKYFLSLISGTVLSLPLCTELARVKYNILRYDHSLMCLPIIIYIYITNYSIHSFFSLLFNFILFPLFQLILILFIFNITVSYNFFLFAENLDLWDTL